jgi:putative drug exporter of the RND superfamily
LRSPKPRLYRLGVAIARRRRLVIGGWLLLLALCGVLYPSFKRALLAPDYTPRGTQSARAEELLKHRFSALGSEHEALVFHSNREVAHQRQYRETVARVLGAMLHQRGVQSVLSPYATNSVGQISSDEHSVVALVALTGSVRERFDRVGPLQSVATRAARGSMHVWLTGFSSLARELTNVESADIEHAEEIGVPIALLILLLSLGAVGAATVPIVLAAAGLLLTYGALAVLAQFFHFDIFLLTIVTMIGLGIGIDYALFIVSRFREELARADEERPEPDRVIEAVGISMATSGYTILISGLIVGLALVSLFIVNTPSFQEVAVGALAVVVCTLIAALTLLPAVLALLGPRVNRGALPLRLQPADARPDAASAQGGWARWALMIMRHPIAAAATAAAVLLLAAVPVLSLHYGISLSAAALSDTAAGKGEQVLSSSLTPGAVSPIEVVVTGRDGGPLGRLGTARAKTLGRELENEQQVFGVTEHQSAGGVLLLVIPTIPVDSSAADAFVKHIRKDLIPPIDSDGGPLTVVGGTTATTVDFINEIHSKFPLIIAIVLFISLLFLIVIFRSIVLPIKAVVMNLLAIGATLGLLVLVFQDGHGQHLLGFTSPGYIQVYLPVSVFAILFGLSMDYEVFLIRRIQETWNTTHDNRVAVATGVEHTARPISTAAAIMVAVFGSFVTANVMEAKQYGFALAAAVALDATLVRLILVPALMRLFGAWNWWLPQLRRRSAAVETTGSNVC